MRHRKTNKRLNRNRSLRKATLRDLAKSVLLYQSIQTTKVKAKEARRLVEYLISLGKRQDLSSRRLAYAELGDHNLVSLLFNDIAPRFKNRKGGYTRVINWINRKGDNAQKVILELTEIKRIEEEKKVKAERIKKVEQEPSTRERTEVPPRKEQIKEEIKPKVPPLEREKRQIKETKPSKKFIRGLRKFFKKERDSL
jgi:large subunit ribosomal protein L17